MMINSCNCNLYPTGRLGGRVDYAARLAEDVVAESTLGTRDVKTEAANIMYMAIETGTDMPAEIILPAQEGEAGLVELLITGLMQEDPSLRRSAYRTTIRVLHSELSAVLQERLTEVLTDSIRHGEVPLSNCEIRCQLRGLLDNQARTLSLDSRLLIGITLDELAQ